ncbi:polysaccharide biosynthesis/export family protein [Collimonas antrihumi]|uniref:polysaccharide biosynthesis/export family protein n=1 Tax=Collimonas antrihumi TaxID=1940615 RepID=UPI001FE907D3|nr:polysaccharide biosynthesis/export family protein [Collimonas antrihumi]
MERKLLRGIEKYLGFVGLRTHFGKLTIVNTVEYKVVFFYVICGTKFEFNACSVLSMHPYCLYVHQEALAGLRYQVNNFMHFFTKTHLKMCGVVGLIPLLAACALAPGMHMDDKYVPKQTDSGVVPTIKPITPELLQAEKTLRDQQPSQDISPLLTKPAPYRIGSGDILSVVVWDHPELSTPAMGALTTITTSSGGDNSSSAGAAAGTAPGFVVDQDGLVQFPYVGPTKVVGMTEAEARKVLTAKLARYVKKPDLTLRVQAYRSQRVYLDGEIKAPGVQAINDIAMTLPEAINRAGGFLPTGDQSQVNITRAGTTYVVNLPRLAKKGINPSRILLTNDDAVRVLSREESKVFVLGEVSRPITLTLRNGSLTLNEALGDAGGINPLSSDGRQVYVVRNASSAEPIVYYLDARSPVAFALAENFELKAKDVVYVDASGLAKWSRVVSLIVPSAQSVTSAVQVTK